jgi:O-antigen ligase
MRALAFGILSIVLVARFAKSQKQVDSFILAYVLGSVVSVAGIFLSYIVGQHYFRDAIRYSASGLDPNDLGVILSLSIPMTWYLIIKHKNQAVKAALMIYSLLCIFTIILTASRGAFLALLVALLVIPWTFLKMSTRVKIFFGLSIIILAYCILFFVPQNTMNRVLQIPNDLQTTDLNERTVIWSDAGKVFVQHPYFGVGAGGFKTAVGKYMEVPAVAHNTLLSILTEEGVVGAAIFFMILAMLLFFIANLPELERKIWSVIILVWFVGTASLTWDFYLQTYIVFAIIAAQYFLLRAKDEI